jgi:hypothetical protein
VREVGHHCSKQWQKGREGLAQEGKEWGVCIRCPDSLTLYTLTRRLGGAVRGAWCPHPPRYPDTDRGPEARQLDCVVTNSAKGEEFHGHHAQTATVASVQEPPQ